MRRITVAAVVLTTMTGGVVAAAPVSAASKSSPITCVNDADGDGYTITVGKKSHHYETGTCEG